MEATMEMRKSNLVLPQGFVPMDRDEMMYVDGGVRIPQLAVAMLIDLVLIHASAPITAALGPLKWFGKSLANKIIKKTASGWIGLMQTAAKMIAGVSFNVTVGVVSGLLFTTLWKFTTVGGVAAYVMDWVIDGNPNDNWINF